jgi:sarcosine oxidase, subunit beta
MTARTAEAIVVGGGVNGTSTAFHLAERGIKTVLLERHDIASAGTGKSGALVRMHYTDPHQAKLVHESLPYFTDWSDRVGAGEPGFVRCGVIVTASAQSIPALRANVRMLQRVGINTCLINSDDLVRLQPWVDPTGIEVCAFEPDSGCAMPGDTARSFAGAARKYGAEIVSGTRVTGITTTGGRVTGVTTEDGDWSAPAVVVCAGVWSVPLLAGLGVELPIQVNRTGAFLLQRQGDVPLGPAGHMVMLDRAFGSYFRPYGESETLAGGGGRSRQTESPDDYDEDADPELIRDVSQLVARRVPSMAGAPVTRGWSGITDVTPDHAPILEVNAGADGLYLAAGFSGTGFKISPYVGQLMATWVATGERPADAAPFRLSRYDEGRPIVAEHPYVTDTGEAYVDAPH